METKTQKYCETCGQAIVDYKITLTKRNLIWLYALGYIGKKKYSKEGYWVNYKEVHELCAKKFGKMVDGKWKPMVLSSYSTMSQFPWLLIENSDKTDEKYKSTGSWKLTKAGIDFINNKIQVPEMAWFTHTGHYKSSRLIYAHEVKGVNFQELVDLFNSF